MAPKIRYNLWITEAQRDGLRGIKGRDGVPESEQIRRAIDAWLTEKGVTTKKAARKRADTRTRA